MRNRSLFLSTAVLSFVCLLLIGSSFSQEPASDLEQKPETVSLAVARDRAKLLHQVYTSTLEVMHQRYFHGDRAIVPARAMEDVFSDIQRKYSIEARWIAATMRAMNIDHDPETPFERHAAAQITSGKSEIEEVSSGYYRRAVAIPLTGGCINCHGGSLSRSTRKQFAGLVISIPVDAGGDSADAK